MLIFSIFDRCLLECPRRAAYGVSRQHRWNYTKRAYGWDVVHMTYERRLQASSSTYTLKREKFQESMYCIEHDNDRCPGCDYMPVLSDSAYTYTLYVSDKGGMQMGRVYT